jgi:hypothetical protein
MDIIILDEIEFKPQLGRVLKNLRLKPDSGAVDMVQKLLEEACQIARPKAIYRIAGVDIKGQNGVVIEGIQMESRVMAVNLQDVHRVFPYIVTSGRELYDWKNGFEDLLEAFYADTISQIALQNASNHLLDHLKTTYQLGKTATMNPGSLEDWPITAQPSLFQLLGNPLESIGVELLESMLMVPNHTVSGIRFVSEEGYSNCELCPREPCPHRRTPYNPALMDRKYN